MNKRISHNDEQFCEALSLKVEEFVQKKTYTAWESMPGRLRSGHKKYLFQPD